MPKRARGSVVERLLCKQEAAGAIPAESKTSLKEVLSRNCEGNLDDKHTSWSGCDYKEKRHAIKGFACECNTKTAYEHLKTELEAQLPYLPKHCIVEIRKMVIAQFVKRFKRSRIPKYGSLNKGFTERELQLFFRVVTDPKFRLLFLYQANLGLRLGEAIKINIKDIKFESRELVVKTEKAMALDTLLVPAPLFKETLEYIRSNARAIEHSGGYLFFKEEGKSHTKAMHMGEGYVRNQFRGYVKEAGLDEIYDQSDESRPSRYRISNHNLGLLKSV